MSLRHLLLCNSERANCILCIRLHQQQSWTLTMKCFRHTLVLKTLETVQSDRLLEDNEVLKQDDRRKTSL